MREKHHSVASRTCPPQLGAEPVTQAWAPTGNRPGAFRGVEGRSDPVSHAGQGEAAFRLVPALRTKKYVLPSTPRMSGPARSPSRDCCV